MAAIASILISLILLMVPVTASWDDLNCTEVPYNILQSARVQSNWPFVGPRGLYAFTPDNKCIYADGAPNGTFQEQFPKEFSYFMDAVKYFETKVGPLRLEFKLRATQAVSRSPLLHIEGRHFQNIGCGDVCGGTFVDSVECPGNGCRNCQTIEEYCQEFTCSILNVCK